MKTEEKILAQNRKASFEYFLLEHYEVGLELKGSEIKSIRAGQMSIAEAYVRVDRVQAFLLEANIPPYAQANRYNHDPKRPRKLLLHKKEIRELFEVVRQKGVTIVPLKVYLKNGKAKLEIATAKGKKLHDKRETIAKRDQEREMQRERK